MISTAINTFWQSAIVNGRSFLNEEPERKMPVVKMLISIFYFFNLFTAIQPFSKFYQTPDWQTLLASELLFDPLWSMKWASYLDWNQCVIFVLLFYLIASVIALISWERFRLSRILAFVSVFLYLSLISSFGKVDHNYHLLVVSSFMLIFLPGKDEKFAASDYLKVFFSIQTFILLTYFISGFFKLYGILDQEIRGFDSALVPDALALNLAKTSYAAASDYFLSDFFLNHTSRLFSVILIAGYLIEFLSIYILFKPRMHRFWGLLIITLHIGILMSVGPDFTVQIFVVGIFLVFSPFSSLGFDLSQDFTAIIATLKSPFQATRLEEFVIFYDGDCLMCNGFLKFLARYDLPSTMKICKQQSPLYLQLLEKNPDLAEIDSIVVLEKRSTGYEVLRIKAQGIVWVLSKVSRAFLPLKFLFSVSPFSGNLIYDIRASRRKVDPVNCPIPPTKMRDIMVQ